MRTVHKAPANVLFGGFWPDDHHRALCRNTCGGVHGDIDEVAVAGYSLGIAIATERVPRISVVTINLQDLLIVENLKACIHILNTE